MAAFNVNCKVNNFFADAIRVVNGTICYVLSDIIFCGEFTAVTLSLFFVLLDITRLGVIKQLIGCADLCLELVQGCVKVSTI